MNETLTNLASKKLGVAATGLVLLYMMNQSPSEHTSTLGILVTIITSIYVICQAGVDVQKEKKDEKAQ